jgi:hypothetical protein
MRTMQRTILTLALAAAVALSATPAHARRKAAPPPVKSSLTTDEWACQLWGKIYFWIGTARDELMPITTTIDMARKLPVHFRRSTSTPETQAAFADALVRSVHAVYANPDVSPARYQYITELKCMQPAEAADPTPDARVWR